MGKELVSQDYIKETLALKHQIEGAFIHLGERLYLIRKEEMWQGMYNSYAEFLEEMGVTEGQASKMRQIYERFILKLNMKVEEIAPYGIRRLYEILPMCTDKRTTRETLDSIKGLTASDVHKKIKAEKAGEHKHVWFNYKMCNLCKESRRVYENN